MPIDFEAELKELKEKEKKLEAQLDAAIAAGNQSCEHDYNARLKANQEAQTVVFNKLTSNRPSPPSWGQNTRIFGAQQRKGIRSLMYNAAQECGAYANDPLRAMVYEGDDLVISLLFQSFDMAIKMRNAALSLTQPPISMPGAAVDAGNPVQVVASDVETVEPVLGKHYDPKASKSSQQTLDCLMSASDASPSVASVVSLDDDLCIHQSIENPNHPLLRLQRPEKCHIVPKAKGGRNDSSNYLALWCTMHQLYDGISTPMSGVPEILIELDKNVADQPLSITPQRTKIGLIIRARTEVAAVGIVDQLRVGTQKLDPTTFSTSVNILNDEVDAFKSSLQKQALTNTILWNAAEGNIPHPAVVEH